MTNALHEVLERIQQLSKPCIIGITGPVAVGKTTFANDIAERLQPLRVEVVSTDGFLHSTAVLLQREILHRKGFPESFDLENLRQVLLAFAENREVTVPEYSHTAYDVLPEPRFVPRADVYIVEGVVAFAHRNLLSLRIYLDAAEEHVYEWYAARIRTEVEKARLNDRSFYRRFIDMAPSDLESFMREIWLTVNAVNLHEHIGPERDRADVVLLKAGDHQLVEY